MKAAHYITSGNLLPTASFALPALPAIVAKRHHSACRSEKRDGHSDASLQQSIDRIWTAFRFLIFSHATGYRLAPAYL